MSDTLQPADVPDRDATITPAVGAAGPVFVMTGTSAWISIGDICVHLVRNDEGVLVDLYPDGGEDEDSMAGTSLSFAEALAEMESRQEAVTDVSAYESTS